MKIHCIGIGGIGVSALAQYYLDEGHEVSGSDLAASEITDFLKAKSIAIAIGNSEANVPKGVDLVVYSPAVRPDNPEYRQAKAMGAKLMSYPEALGELTKKHYTIAVAGAHGKSTTTAMIGLILARAGLDPTVIVGTKLKEFGESNFRRGKGKYLVIEACEYDGSFLNYAPKVIAITNMDKEHMDYFKTFSNVVKTFREFINKLPNDGALVWNKDDKNLNKIINSQFSIINKFSTIKFSIKQNEAKKIKKLLKIPGWHNVSNALAALTAAKILGIDGKIAFEALSEYRGSWRRFEIKKGTANGKAITVVSDYGHHPNEVIATLKAAREKYPKKTIWCIFQPHQYQRTYYLFNDFIKVFRKAPIDHIIITDIYDVAGREEKKISSQVTSKTLARKISKKHVRYLPESEAETFVKTQMKREEVLVIMGAGDIYKMVDRF